MDTKKTVNELLASGLTQQELADLISCGQSTINAFSKGNRGARPSYEIGKSLEELHKLRCPAKKNRRKTAMAEPSPDHLPYSIPNSEKHREAVGPGSRLPIDPAKEMT